MVGRQVVAGMLEVIVLIQPVSVDMAGMVLKEETHIVVLLRHAIIAQQEGVGLSLAIQLHMEVLGRE